MSNEIATETRNFFESYAAATSSRSFVGDLLKFSKGDWLAGMDNEEIPVGTRLVAVMPTLESGWQRWENNAPTDAIMGPVAEGFTPPRRKELGDEGSSLWELDNEGKPRDPWQFCNRLVLVDSEDRDSVFTFTTSSKGGLGAVGTLCGAFGKAMRQRPNELPVVELGVGSYAHRDKSLGRIKFPTLAIVGWVEAARFEAIATTPDETELIELPKLPPKAKATPKKK